VPVTEFTAVVLAHTDPPQVRRLLTALEDVPIVLHCDARTPRDVAADMLDGLPPWVTVLPSRATTLASWSLVAAELAGVRAALDRSDARHVAVLTGSDYPLVSTEGLVRELSAWEGFSWFWNQPMPFRPWDTPRHTDGGLWRLRHRFLTRADQVLFVRGIPLRWPLRRRLPDGVEARAGAQWKIYARHHAERLLEVADARPDLVDFWRTSLVPEETFAASVLGSRTLLGDDALPPCAAHAWHVAWRGELREHPDWFDEGDFDELAAARQAEPVGPDTAFLPWAGQQRPGRKLFARKFSSSTSAGVLDRVDAELRRVVS
jgi:hypothetical protein